jgi:hypothetical protein
VAIIMVLDRGSYIEIIKVYYDGGPIEPLCTSEKAIRLFYSRRSYLAVIMICAEVTYVATALLCDTCPYRHYTGLGMRPLTRLYNNLR